VLAAIIATPLLIAVPNLLLPGLAAFILAGVGLVWLGRYLAKKRRLSQIITLWPDQLEINTAGQGEERQLQRLDIGSVRLRLVRDAYERTTGVFLRHENGELELGSFLSVEDKSSFARAFGSALRQARRSA
jgi:uncharacterized membrane protein